MNKKIMNALTGVVVSTTMIGTNVIPVMAEETIEEIPVQEITFETPEQFVETYINVETNSVDVLVEVFEQQTLEMQEQICALCEAQGLVLNLIEPVEEQQEQLEAQPEVEQPVEQPQEPVQQPEVEEIVLSVQEVAEPEEEVVLEVAQAPEQVQPEEQQVQPVAEQVQPEEQQEQPAQTLMEAPILEKVVQQPEIAQQPVVEQVQPLANVLKESSTQDNAAQNFVDTYLSANGVVYTAADSSNYQRILAGVSTWNQMSTKQKAKVNAILTRSANKTYQQLLQEAQAIQVQQTGTTSTYVNGRIVTGTQTNEMPIILALVGAAIVGILAFLGLKKKNK